MSLADKDDAAQPLLDVLADDSVAGDERSGAGQLEPADDSMLVDEEAGTNASDGGSSDSGDGLAGSGGSGGGVDEENGAGSGGSWTTAGGNVAKASDRGEMLRTEGVVVDGADGADNDADNDADGDAEAVEDPEARTAAPAKSIRLQSLDVFRGITIAWMVFVDNVGASWPEVDHSPWDGAAPADFVMPNFDFIVGVAAVFSLSRFTAARATTGDRCAATRKIFVRFVKLFLLGIATQCGVDLFLYNLSLLRIMGILQRVACCYLVAALAEVWVCGCCCCGGARGRHGDRPESYARPGVRAFCADHFTVVRQHASQFVVGLVLIGVHLGILYGLDVPDFVDGVAPGVNVTCGRGVLTPACNAASYVDQKFFGVNHMYFPSNGGGDGRDVTFQRLGPCSSCSPGKCGNYSAGLWPAAPGDNGTGALLPPPPAWCCTADGDTGACPAHASFDPEGLTSTFTCVVAALIGLHYGHIFKALHWLLFSLVLVVAGAGIHLTHDCHTTPGLCTGGLNMPWNTDLYSFPFLLFTSGISGLILCLCFVVIDVAPHCARRALQPFRWLGLNAITIYVLAEGGVPDWVCAMFYWKTPEQNLQNILWPTGVYWGQDEDAWMERVDFVRETHSIAILFWCVGYIGVWTAVAGVMHSRRVYIKI